MTGAFETIRVRRPCLADRQEVARFFVDQEGGTLEEHGRGFEREVAADHPDNLLLVAEADGCIVGFARARRFQHPPERPADIAPEGWYLLGVTVAPAFRRRGVATALTRRRLEWIAERADEAWFFTEVTNHASVALHQRFGFVEVSREFHFPRRISSEPGILFRLSLRGPAAPRDPAQPGGPLNLRENPMDRLEGRVALVIGGSAGIGRAVAQAFARRGARVAIAARGREQGEAVAEQIRSTGAETFFVAGDLANPGDVEQMIRGTVDRFGRLDAAVNNAAAETGAFRATADFEEEEFDQTIATNLKGVWLAMKHEITRMLAQQPSGGAIVNTSSVNGLGAAPAGSIYSATKAGVLALTKAAAMEYATAGIRVNALVPGAFRTPMLERVFERAGGAEVAETAYQSLIPMGRIGRPEEAAEAVVWLCSDAASYVTGHSMIVDGGMTAAFR